VPQQQRSVNEQNQRKHAGADHQRNRNAENFLESGNHEGMIE
jgi:hypothetical protein